MSLENGADMSLESEEAGAVAVATARNEVIEVIEVIEVNAGPAGAEADEATTRAMAGATRHGKAAGGAIVEATAGTASM